MYFSTSATIFILTCFRFNEAILIFDDEQNTLKSDDKNYQCFCTDGKVIKNLPHNNNDLIKKLFVQPEPKNDILQFLKNLNKIPDDNNDILKQLLSKLDDKPKLNIFDKIILERFNNEPPNNNLPLKELINLIPYLLANSDNNDKFKNIWNILNPNDNNLRPPSSCLGGAGVISSVPNPQDIKEVKFIQPSPNMYTPPGRISIHPEKVIVQNDLQRKPITPQQQLPVKPINQESMKKNNFDHHLPIQDIYMRPRFNHNIFRPQFQIPNPSPSPINPRYIAQSNLQLDDNYPNPGNIIKSTGPGYVGIPNILAPYSNPGMHVNSVYPRYSGGSTQPINIGYNGLGLKINAEIPTYYSKPNTGILNVGENILRSGFSQEQESNVGSDIGIENQNDSTNNQIENTVSVNPSRRNNDNLGSTSMNTPTLNVPSKAADINSVAGESSSAPAKETI